MNGGIKIFGREPAVFVAMIGSILTVIAATGLDFINSGAAAAITALISAAVLAWTTRPVAPALLTGTFSALVAVFTEYGLELSEQLVGSISGAILAIFAFITSVRVGPVDTAITRSAHTGGLSITPNPH